MSDPFYLDIANGGFEFVGAYFTWRSAYQLYRDQEIKGVYWPMVAFFTTWGLWNLWYYPNLHQWASAVGALLLVCGNGAWVIQAVALKYGRRDPHRPL